jgi:hypothetical protein
MISSNPRRKRGQKNSKKPFIVWITELSLQNRGIVLLIRELIIQVPASNYTEFAFTKFSKSNQSNSFVWIRWNFNPTLFMYG